METIHLHQQAQGPVGFEQVVISVRGRMVGFAGVAPGTIRLLFFDQPYRLWQSPERLDRPNSLPQQVTLDEVVQGGIASTEQSRQWVNREDLDPLLPGITSTFRTGCRNTVLSLAGSARRGSPM